jgi:nitronate monooxygenase
MIADTGGIGFIGAGTDVADLSTHLDHATRLLHDTNLATRSGTMPIGVGFINWGANLSAAIPLIEKFKPAAVWFFAPSSLSSLQGWTSKARTASPETKIWVQVGSVKEAREVMQYVEPDVLVIQGTDAGGHGLAQGASLMSLLPEVHDAIESNNRPVLVAAGGIADARGASASFLLGASGVVMGTRFLACPEANIPRGYQNQVLRASDGGQTTVRTKVYDTLRGTTGWAESHNARGIVNRSYFDAIGGMDENENKRLYHEEMQKGDEGWGEEARMTAYAGSAVGLVKSVERAGEIVMEVREGVRGLLGGARALL